MHRQLLSDEVVPGLRSNLHAVWVWRFAQPPFGAPVATVLPPALQRLANVRYEVLM